MKAREMLAGCEHVIVLSGDHPLLEASLHHGARRAPHLLRRGGHRDDARARRSRASTGASCRSADGEIERIVETKNPGDATPAELAIREVNTGTYAFAVEPLFEALAGVRADNSQGEYYLGDVLPLLRGAGHGWWRT